MKLSRHVRLSVVAVLLFGIAPVAHGQNIALTWTGGGGVDTNWTTVGNWGGVNYPSNGQPVAGNTYTATINSGTPMLNSSFTIDTFNWNGGTISGGGQLTVNTATNLSGTLSFGGTFVFASAISASNSSLTITSGGGAGFYANTGAVWTNSSTASLTFTGDAGMFNNQATGMFTNSSGATFQKTGGTGATTVNWTFTNNGTINATSGTINFGGTSNQNGAITIGTSGIVEISGPSTWIGSGGSSGTGSLQFVGGTASFNGTNNLASPVNFSGGSIDGTGNMTISGPLTWSTTSLGATSNPGVGTTTLSGGANVTGSPIVNRTVNNASGSVVTLSGGSGNGLYANASAVWMNQSGSTFTFSSDAGIVNNGGTGQFTNASGAIFQKTGGTGSSTVTWTFTNNGTVNATSGTLNFSGTSAQNGVITIGASGIVEISGPSTWTGTGGTTGAGSLQFVGGTALFNGTNNLASPVNFSGGTIDGTGAMTISGPLTWSGTALGASSNPGVGTTTLSGGATVSGSPIVNRTVNNASGSVVTLSGGAGNGFYSGSSANWQNQAGSTFTFSSDAGLLNNTGTGSFTNASGAIFQKTGGTGASAVQWTFANNGTVNATSGTLNFSGTSTQNGAITIGAGGIVEFSGPSTWTGSGGSSGTGSLQFVSGVAMFNSTNNLASPVNFSGGTIDGTGAMTISGPLTWSTTSLGDPSNPAAGTTTLSGGGNVTGSPNMNRTVNNASGSVVALSGGAGNGLYSGSSANWQNQSGSTFSFTSDAGLYNNGGTGSFTNAGGAIFQKTGGTGASAVQWTTTNNGTVNATSGTLNFSGTSFQNGAITIGTNGVVEFSGPSTWTGTGGSSGTGSLQFVSGTALFNGTNNLASPVTFSGGTIDGTGAMTISGPLTWSGTTVGNFSSPGAGTTTLTGGANVTGAPSINRTVNNASGSIVSLTGGAGNGFYSYSGAAWMNQTGSTFAFTSDAGLINNGGAGQFTNASGATFEKTGGTATSSVGWNFTNNGTVLAASGTLSFSSGTSLTNYSAGTLTGGVWRVLAGATLDLSASRLISTIATGTTVELNGVGSAFPDVENNLTAVAGNLNILGGRHFAPPGTVADTGIVTVGQTAGDGSQFVGAVNVNSGGLLRGSGAVTSVVTVAAGGTVSAAGFNFTIGSLAGSAGTVNDNVSTPGTLTIGTDNTSTSFGGSIVNGSTGALSLVKVGFGTLTLIGTNSFSGGVTVNGGTLQIPNDASLGGGPVTAGGLGTVTYSTTTSTSRSFTLSGGTLSVASGQTVTLNGSQLAGGYLAGPGSFATSAATGAVFAGVTTRPSATITSNSSLDQFINVTNGGNLNIAAGPTSPVSLVGMTNAGSGTITVAANSKVNATDFQSFGVLTVTNGPVGTKTLMTNVGTTPLSFDSGSRTFIGSVGGNITTAGIELNGQNAIVSGGLFVNNGQVTDNSIAGISTIIADYGALVKGAGQYDNSPVTRNGGKFQAGNSPGVATVGRFVFGPGGVSNYVFAIDDATGTAGPTPDAQDHVSGWGLVKAATWQRTAGATSGDFAWTADATNKLTFAIDTLVNPTTPGTDVPGLMADFDPTRSYSWPAVEWSGTYSGPTDVAALDAATNFDTSGFANPIAGTFGWDLGSSSLSLSYTPSAVPEPGTLALVGFAAAVIGWRRRLKFSAFFV